MIESLAMFARSRRGVASIVGLLVVTAVAAIVLASQRAVDDGLTATVRKGTLSARLTTTGILKPAQSTTYRSRLAGRDSEITFLVPEGTLVQEGDLIVRLDVVALERDLARAVQDTRQVGVELQVAQIEVQEAKATIDSLAEGEAALAVEEAQTNLSLADKKAERLREEYQTLQPLLEKGFITREELRKTSAELERAEEDLALMRKRTDVLVQRTRPRENQRATLQLAQKEAQLENVRTRLQESEARLRQLRAEIESASIYTLHPGIVVYEEYLGANPRRKIRAGDRVTESQGIVTIPEVNRMLVEASVGEGDIERLQVGQKASIVLEAFRDRMLTGKVTRIGTLARSSIERPFEQKRFDLVVDLDRTDVELRPEMTARVDVLTGERAGVLLVPVNAIFERDGLSVVHLRRSLGDETRQVQLGESSETFVEIVAGLSEGDRVLLTDVTKSDVPPGAASSSSGARPLASRAGARGLGPR